MLIKRKEQDKIQPNKLHNYDGSICHYKDGYVDSMGRKQTIYCQNKYFTNDYSEVIREVEEDMLRWCEKNGEDFRYLDKWKWLKKRSPHIYQRYAAAHKNRREL